MQIPFHTTITTLLSDIHTPVGIYLRLRDRYRDSILLESAQQNSAEHNFSIIGLEAIAGVEITTTSEGEYKLPSRPAKKLKIQNHNTNELLGSFINKFIPQKNENQIAEMAQGVFGYCSYDAVQLFEKINFKSSDQEALPLIRYRLYQYVIIIDHYKEKMHICENHFETIPSAIDDLMARIVSKDIPAFPFTKKGELNANIEDADFKMMVKKGIEVCKQGEVFQVVLSRKFRQAFTGDDFNIYRSLRSINPSPYLFYFDYGDYKIAGSSPEAQVIAAKGKVVMHPIAGTILRSGNEEIDSASTAILLSDEKENAEHTMLVDLARNDLSKIAASVHVSKNKEVQNFSHVIHLVSEVCGSLSGNTKPFDVISATFPAGTLSGAPKYRAMEIIDELETEPRSFYGGVIGFIGFNGDVNHAIIIRSYLAKDNSITLQAGAGVVAASTTDGELQEVNNKLSALVKAMEQAEKINN